MKRNEISIHGKKSRQRLQKNTDNEWKTKWATWNVTTLSRWAGPASIRNADPADDLRCYMQRMCMEKEVQLRATHTVQRCRQCQIHKSGSTAMAGPRGENGWEQGVQKHLRGKSRRDMANGTVAGQIERRHHRRSWSWQCSGLEGVGAEFDRLEEDVGKGQDQK